MEIHKGMHPGSLWVAAPDFELGVVVSS